MFDRNCLSELHWLPPAPTSIKEKIKQIKKSESSLDDITNLTSTRLTAAQSSTIGKLIQKESDVGNTICTLSNLSLGVVSNGTTELAASCFAAAAARHGVQLKLTLTPFNQMVQQAIDPASLINTEKPDVVLIAVDYHWLDDQLPETQQNNIPSDIDASLSQMRELVENFRTNGNAVSIVQTIPVPPTSLFGNYDRRVPTSLRSRINHYNDSLMELAKETRSYVFDVAAIAERIGTDQWFDAVQWNAYKLPFSGEFNLIYSDLLGRLLGSIRGKSKKCLVLDLDNTLWGGVIGDDGVDGIQIGQGNAEGEAFLSIQRLALDYKERGIILAVCSKNNDETARSGFRDNPNMLLKESDIAVFQANWVDKASNLEAIAETLNIGVDALVLLDDNPAERAQVRAALPRVGVPELPDDPALFPLFLTSAGYFEATSFSDDDKLRSASYASNAQRSEVKAKSRDIGEYLNSLQMELDGRSFDKIGLERITQLTNKTNQFNLTTTRATVTEIEDQMTSKNVYTLQVRLKDSIGDLGMIGILVAKKHSTHWNIEQWLMSCRVLGRKVEEAMLSIIVSDAKKEGADILSGSYIPTAKNNMVRDHYSKLGFELDHESDSGIRSFKLELDNYTEVNLPMKVNHQLSSTDNQSKQTRAA